MFALQANIADIADIKVSGLTHFPAELIHDENEGITATKKKKKKKKKKKVRNAPLTLKQAIR